MSVRLTPMQELALEVLAARFRTGEEVWTFASKHGAALASLEAAGLAFTMHGIIQGTVRAGLTDYGKLVALGADYRPPPGGRCPFCELAETMRESAASNRMLFVVEDTNPKAETHLLVIPRKHVVSLDDASPSLLAALFTKAAQVGREANPGGYRVIVNVGEDGKQRIPHLHVHVLAGAEVLADGFARGVG